MNISAEHPRLDLLSSWLCHEKTENNATPQYVHLRLQEHENIDSAVLDELFAYIDHAHAGARQALREPLGDSLHPLKHNTEMDPAFGYPERLGAEALKAFFGEITAGIVAEYFVGSYAHEWEVPVYLFRMHTVAFQQLEMMKQTNNWNRQIVGRTGDDGLAFKRNSEGHIFAWLACEAKCTGSHSSTMIAENHKKLSHQVHRPIDLLRMIVALKDYRDDDYSRQWIKALRDQYWKNAMIPRFDCSVYVYGQRARNGRPRIPTDQPHRQYTGGRNLFSAEVFIENVERRLVKLYERMGQPV